MEDARATASVTRVFIVDARRPRRVAGLTCPSRLRGSQSRWRTSRRRRQREFCVTCPIAAAEDVDEDEDEDEDEDGVLGGREGRRLEGVREDGRVDDADDENDASGCFLRGDM